MGNYTEESNKACEMLVDAGVPVGCQTVLLKGVNDDPEVMKDLMKKLLGDQGKAVLHLPGRL